MRNPALLLSLMSVLAAASPNGAPEGWETSAPRDEIRPRFSYQPNSGRSGKGAFVIEADARDGLDGCWARVFPVIGFKYYRFTAWHKTQNVALPRQSVIVKIRWTDAAGKTVLDDRPLVEGFLKGFAAWVPPEYPPDRQVDSTGWTEVSDTYQAPSKAEKARVELHLQWAPKGRVDWSDVAFREADPPAPRIVRLATAHFRPQGKEPARNRESYVPLIEEAARRKADLLVLGETLTYYGTGARFDVVAEPVPGPSTEYFGGLARKHGMYIVAGIVERAGHLVYNTSVLLGPDGSIVGKYRKVTLPDGEVDAGIAPGRDYPVFETRFGRVGMMICYDGFFPEVARELTKRGAEVIAWPVWGCNPDLARARAAENHVYVVSSTYEAITRNWMLSAVWSHTGETLAVGKEFGAVAIAEVDLAKHTRWPSLGDFKAKVERHRPVVTVD